MRTLLKIGFIQPEGVGSMWNSFRSSVQTMAETAVLVFGSLIWGPALVAASLWVWFGIGYESAITIAMGLLGLSMTVVGLFLRHRSKV